MGCGIVKQTAMSMTDPERKPRPRLVRWLEWGALLLLLGGVAVYLLGKPLNPMANPEAAQALGLVQMHPARSAPSIRQALGSLLQTHRKPGRTPSIGEWTVQANNRTRDRQGYLVRVDVRVPGDQPDRWIEWQYLWLVRLPSREVIPLSRPASEIMP